MREKLAEELSQYSGGLLAYKGWGMAGVDKVHSLKVESTKNIVAIFKEMLDNMELPECEISEAEVLDALYNKDNESPKWARMGYLEAQQDLLKAIKILLEEK